MSFEKIDICDIKDSFTRLVRDDWALLTAGKDGQPVEEPFQGEN